MSCAERCQPRRECIRVSFPVRQLSLKPGGLFSLLTLTAGVYFYSEAASVLCVSQRVCGVLAGDAHC